MPMMAVKLAMEEVLRMGWLTHEMLEKAEDALLKDDGDAMKWVFKHEKDVDEITHSLESFLESIPGEKLNPDDQDKLEDMKHLITDIERVGDHANNLAEFARQLDDKKISVSKAGQKELKILFKKVLQNYKVTLKALKSGDETMVTRVLTLEEEIDALEKQYKLNHIERLKKKICHPEADTIFIESLRNLERISDHAYNLALTLIY